MVQPTKLASMAPKLDFVLQSRVIFNPVMTLGTLGGMGVRMMVPILGGDFEGPSLHGRILPGGAEWPFIRPDGVGIVDARYSWETDDGVLINVRNTGYRHGPPEVMAKLNAKQAVDPRTYYLRTYTVFEAPDGPYSWLTRHVFIGMGERQPEVLFLWYYILR
jgi:hypothetical protein